MKKIYFVLLSGLFILGGCKKEDKQAPLVANFAFDTQNSTSIVVPESNYFTFKNLSQNAVSYLWDLGNGQTSTEKQPVTTYPDAGTYKVTLIAKAANGVTATEKKEIKVVAPVMKTITIENLTLSSDVFHVPALSQADVWVEVKVKDRSIPDVLLSNGTIKRDLLYKTAIYANAVSGAGPITFNVSGKQVLSHNLTDKNYSFELYALNNGTTYLLYSTDYLGASFLGNVKTNNFIWSGQINTKVVINGDYE